MHRRTSQENGNYYLALRALGYINRNKRKSMENEMGNLGT